MYIRRIWGDLGEHCYKVLDMEMKARKKNDKYDCHACMREILSYLHFRKTTSISYMYEATIVNKILMQVLYPKNA